MLTPTSGVVVELSCGVVMLTPSVGVNDVVVLS